MKQNIIKKLKDKIEHLEVSVRNAQNENIRLETKLERFESEERREIEKISFRGEMIRNENRTMTEIIRWLVNPECAKSELEYKMKMEEKGYKY